MRKLLAILIILLPTICYANDFYIVSPIRGSGGATGSTTLLDYDFSGLSDGVEWSTDSWTEQDATSDVFVTDTDVTMPDCTYCGTSTVVGMMVAQSSAADRRVYRTFTGQTSGYITVEFDVRMDGIDHTQNLINIWVDTTSILTFSINTSEQFQFYGNSAWDIAASTYVADTWYHIEIEMNMDDSDGTDCYRLWVDNTEDTNSPFDAAGHNDPEGANRIGNNLYFAQAFNQNHWIANLLIYTGQRQ